MREQKNKRGLTAASLTVEVETTPLAREYETHLLAGQVFYLLDRDLSEILRKNKKAIWGELLKKIQPSLDGVRGKHIREILTGSNNRRKYTAAFICTADNMSRVNLLLNSFYAKAIDAIRIEAVKFFVIDSKGKAEIEDLETGTYYVCGVGETGEKRGIWNVRVELKRGMNYLRLDSDNITGRQS